MPAEPAAYAAPAYAAPARALHWLTAILVIATFPAGVIMTQEGLARPVQDALYMFHKNVGVLILLLVAGRLIYRIANPPPPLPATIPALQRSCAHAVHALLYLLLIVMAVSGYIRVVAGGFPLELWDAIGVPRLAPQSEGLAKQAQAVHGVARFGLFALILLHVGAAVFHGLVKRDGVVRRMWPGPVR